jgi:hypothetical protein
MGRWRRGSTQIQPVSCLRLAFSLPALIVADNEASRIFIVAKLSENHSRGVFTARLVVRASSLRPLTLCHTLDNYSSRSTCCCYAIGGFIIRLW